MEMVSSGLAVMAGWALMLVLALCVALAAIAAKTGRNPVAEILVQCRNSPWIQQVNDPYPTDPAAAGWLQLKPGEPILDEEEGTS